MMLQAQDDSTLAIIFLIVTFVIPFIVLWFDDAAIHK